MYQLEISPEELLSLLSVGRENAKTASTLRVEPRAIRYAVNKLRKDGVPICSGNEGYWIARNTVELEQTISIFKAKYRDMLETAISLEYRLVDLERWLATHGHKE